VHSSIHEGFGLPVAEAMRWDLPVAAADNSAVRELFGGLYIPFETGSPESAAAAISKALASRPDHELVESRRSVLEGLSWRNCAGRTAEAFEAAAGRSRP
jgi:glycosyltransferase involved in cell wall biosynthesis